MQEGPVISFNAATTLRNFCLWQQTQNVLDDAHPSHHDTAVLITRYSFINITFLIAIIYCFLLHDQLLVLPVTLILDQ